jgi:hypothetical protein
MTGWIAHSERDFPKKNRAGTARSTRHSGLTLKFHPSLPSFSSSNRSASHCLIMLW